MTQNGLFAPFSKTTGKTTAGPQPVVFNPEQYLCRLAGLGVDVSLAAGMPRIEAAPGAMPFIHKYIPKVRRGLIEYLSKHPPIPAAPVHPPRPKAQV